MPLLSRRRPTPYRSSKARSGSNALEVPKPKPEVGEAGSLTASADRVSRAKAESIRRLSQPWQTRSFAYYDLLGEIKYAAQFYARMLAPLKLYAAEVDENGDVNPTEDPEAIAALERLQDPGGGTTGLLSAYGRLMFLTGEGYLMGTKDPDDEGGEAWEMLSTDELRPQDNSYVRYRAPSLAAEEFREPGPDDYQPIDENHAYVYRFWQPHPRFSMLADATMQGVLDLCEELVLLTQAVRSRARSRLAGAGILFIDDRISPPPPETVGDEDPAEDVFLSDLTEAMTSPIVDEGAASAVVPIVVRVPTNEGVSVKDMVAHLQIVDPTQLYPETGLRYEVIKRIAIGLDMPPEILTGTGEVNHWGSWQIDEQTWKGHGAPKADQFVDDLSAHYFRPTLRAAGVTDWKRYRIAYDATAIINHPDRTKDAKDLYDRRAIGKKALRDAGGFTDDDAMTDKELHEAIGIAVRDGGLALYGIPTLRSGSGLEPAAGEIESPSPDGGETAAPDVAKAPPPEPTDQPDQPLPPSVVGSNGLGAARIHGAADLGVLRAREAAGARIRSFAKRDAEVLELIQGLKAGDVAPTLGRDRVRALGCASERDLVAGARQLIADAVRVYGVDEKVAGLIADNVEQHAARTLYDAYPAPLPASFSNYISGLTARDPVPA